MEDKKLKQAAAALKIWIDENRGKHWQALKLLHRDGSRNREARDLMYTARIRLAFQVPLYRALRAASQQNQSVIGGEKGAQLYLRRFRSLQEAMEKAVVYPNSFAKKELFGDGFLQFPMLVPDERMAPLQWQFRTVEELLNDVHEASVAGQRERLQRAHRAEDARKAFLASLTPVQRTVLTAALETAKANGYHAISIDARDLMPPLEA
jgi:hypothetical protein